MNEFIIIYNGKEYIVKLNKSLEKLKEDIKYYDSLLIGRYVFETSGITEVKEHI